MDISIIVPSKDCTPISFLLESLRYQVVEPYELIVVARECNMDVGEICSWTGLKRCDLVVVSGRVTAAMNAGLERADGDIALFLDDDAVAPPWLLKRVVHVFRVYPRRVAAVSGRDLYYDPEAKTTYPTEEDRLRHVITRRIRVLLNPPHPALSDYWCGVYADAEHRIRFGPCIPRYPCKSLLYKAVCLATRREAADHARFPEHPELKHYVGFEQHYALQLVLAGYETRYDPTLTVYHISRRQSLSRNIPRQVLERENNIMRSMIAELLRA